MHFNEAMRQLAERLGLEELRPDASGEYALFFDDTLEVRCASMGKSLRLRGSIGKRAASSPEAEGQMKTLLRHSLARMKDHPEIVSLDAATGKRAASSPEAEGQMKTLLRHSLARMKDHPEIVSLDAATGEFILHRVLALEQLRIESLEQALGDYLNRLEYWRDLFDGTATARRGPALTLLFP